MPTRLAPCPAVLTLPTVLFRHAIHSDGGPTTRRTRSCNPLARYRRVVVLRWSGTFASFQFLLRRGEACLASIETLELCKVPGLQCIMAATHVRLSESRGCSTLCPCCVAPGHTRCAAAAVV